MFDKPVQESELVQYRTCIKSRAERVPLQYITGEVEFYGLPFKVTPAALIPRPETELLVEKILAIAATFDPATKILDIGCGSGIIPVCLAKHLPQAIISAIDISEDAIALAKQNAELNSVQDRINFMNLDVHDASVDALGTFNMIVSNPPYVSKEEFGTLQAEIIKYEPAIAVTDSADGYSFYRLITEKCSGLLNTGGSLLFEMGLGQANTITGILRENGFTDIVNYKDYQQIERVILGKKA
jgi:release factor glutamine methyltransferase